MLYTLHILHIIVSWKPLSHIIFRACDSYKLLLNATRINISDLITIHQLRIYFNITNNFIISKITLSII